MKPLKPFHFEVMWLGHDDFNRFINDSWSTQEVLETNLATLQQNIDKWHKSVFGFVEKKKTKLLARLKGIQNSKAYPFSFLCRLECQLQSELESLLRSEELKWF
ncbi:hypothetical protein QN277_016187 [Acacia crassicarpa]|nr:hypothetical protein QN277_016187 [Acacia crassicarpa]